MVMTKKIKLDREVIVVMDKLSQVTKLYDVTGRPESLKQVELNSPRMIYSKDKLFLIAVRLKTTSINDKYIKKIAKNLIDKKDFKFSTEEVIKNIWCNNLPKQHYPEVSRSWTPFVFKHKLILEQEWI
jgi:hypothetical protein